jgi:uncharacterized protein DUF1579
MTTRWIVGMVLVAVVAVLAPGAVLPAVPEGAMKPPAEIANLQYFDGNWTCDGTTSPGPMGPGGKVTSSVKSHTDFGGFWQSGMVKSSMGTKPAMEGMFHMTYDPGPKEYVLLWVDNTGGYSKETSSGWDGDKIVFTGTSAMGGKQVPTRDTFVKSGKTSMKHDWEGQMDGSSWTAMGSETCKRAVAPAKAAPAKK